MTDGYLSKDSAHLAKLQRERRARMVRIDYTPGKEALAAIAIKRDQCRPGSYAATNSAVLDAIVCEWAELTGINNQQVERPMTSERRPELIDTERAGAYDFGGGSRRHSAEKCGATRHRDGQPCQAKPERGKRRCRFHGGKSTGPRTPEGKTRSLANLRRARVESTG